MSDTSVKAEEKRLDQRVIDRYFLQGAEAQFFGIRAAEMDRESLLAFIGWCERRE
jgi:hypothetical protein